MYQDMNDYELLYLVQENSEEAYGVALEKYRPMIDYYARMYVRAGKRVGIDYDDLYQEGLLGLYHALSSYNQEKYRLFYTYVIVCIRGKMFNLIRSHHAKKYELLNQATSLTSDVSLLYQLEDVVGHDPQFLNQLVFSEMEQEIIRFKHELSFLDSQVFELKMNSFSSPEISTLLDIPLKKTSNILYHVRLKFKKYFQIENDMFLSSIL